MKKAIKITFICLGIMVAPFLLYIALIAFAIGGEFLLVKWAIDNPYVDRRFSHWEEVTIDGFGAFSVPEDWTVTKDGAVYTILDESGETWAYGGIFDEEDAFSDYSDYPSFLYLIYSTSPTIKSTDPFIPFITMDGSDMDQFVFDFEGLEKTFYTLHLSKDMDTEMVWFCTIDLSEHPKQYAIAEALIYSYAFAYAI